jgi:uncharacterized lipoprotein YmbA
MKLLRCAFLTLTLPIALAACGDNAARYLLDPANPQTRIAVRVSSIELRDVSLPSYAAGSDVVVQQADGSLRPAGKAVWADDPVRAVTRSLAENLDVITTASVAAEPWPLEQPADIRVEVRIDRMVARSDGQFQLTGQYAIAALGRSVRESINRFDIARPLEDTTPDAVARATSGALTDLSVQIANRLK